MGYMGHSHYCWHNEENNISIESRVNGPYSPYVPDACESLAMFRDTVSLR